MSNPGEVHAIHPCEEDFQLHYEHPNGRLFQGDSIYWLASLESGTVDLIFCGPSLQCQQG
jgi:site-specific DNA-methyltransferase (adenine-specific)